MEPPVTMASVSALVAESVAAAGDKQTERMESMFANFLAMQQGTAQPQATTDTQAPPEDDAAEVAAVMLAHRQRQAAEASQPFEQLRPAAPGLIHQFSGLQPPSPADQQRSAGMQPQVLHPDRDARLRGGLQRLPTREQYIQRLQTQTEQFSAQEKDDLVHLLTIGAQVSPPHEHVHPMSELGVGRVMVQSRAAPALFRRLQDENLAPPNAGEAMEMAASKIFRSMMVKAAKEAFTIKSFSEFNEFFRKARVVSHDNFDADPDSFWAMLWHTQSVTHIFCKHGWAVALQYHMDCMMQWKEGNLNPASFVETEAFRRGDHKGALHSENRLLAIDTVREAKTGGKTTGSPIQMTPDWTWCEHCQLFFPPTSNHRTGSCQKSARAAAAKKKKK